MPLPQSHLKSLERQLRIHEERLEFLRRQLKNIQEGETQHEEVPVGKGGKKHDSDDHRKESKSARDTNPKARSPEWVKGQREAIEREIRIHEQMIELGHNPKVLDALGELINNREYVSEVARDPKAAARKRGIELPASMIIGLSQEADRVLLQINYYEDLFPFMVTWNSDSGFSPPRETAPSKKGTSDLS